MKVVFASDSFKGSLTSLEANIAMSKGAARAAEVIEPLIIPISDGGDGLIDCLSDALGAKKHSLTVSGPMYEDVDALFACTDEIAVIEMAAASGLILSRGKNDAMEATTYGTGQLIRAALEMGARKLYLGLGGSATTDGGMGALMAMGAVFYDAEGRRIERGCGKTLCQIARADFSHIIPEASEMELIILCDVDYPLLGEQGAAAVFSPQKGASPAQVKALDDGLAHFSEILCNTFPDLRNVPGTGAAGGLGYGLMTVFGGKMLPGMKTILEMIRFEERIQGAELVFTGEGRIDFQSAHGKAPGVIAQAARAQGIPVIVIGGSLTESAAELFSAGASMITPAVCSPVSLEEAIARSEEFVSAAAYRSMCSFLQIQK